MHNLDLYALTLKIFAICSKTANISLRKYLFAGETTMKSINSKYFSHLLTVMS